MCIQEVAGLKEEDLPSDPPTAAGSSSTLSESQYTHIFLHKRAKSGNINSNWPNN